MMQILWNPALNMYYLPPELELCFVLTPIFGGEGVGGEAISKLKNRLKYNFFLLVPSIFSTWQKRQGNMAKKSKL